MKRVIRIIVGFVVLGVIGIYFLFNQTLPVSYGNLVLEANYDGLVNNEELKLYDNGVFSYTDGWTNWNGKYIVNNDSIVLDYYFPVDKPTVYVIENKWLKSYRNEEGKKLLVHDLEIMKNKYWIEVDRILWEDWDPIGVNDLGGPDDEYSRYVASVVKLIEEGADEFKIAKLLHQHANVEAC